MRLREDTSGRMRWAMPARLRAVLALAHRLLAGLVCGLLISMLLGVLGFVFLGRNPVFLPDVGPYLFAGVWVACVLISLWLPSAEAAWQYLMLLAGILALSLPLLGLLVHYGVYYGHGYSATDAGDVVLAAHGGYSITPGGGVLGFVFGLGFLWSAYTARNSRNNRGISSGH